MDFLLSFLGLFEGFLAGDSAVAGRGGQGQSISSTPIGISSTPIGISSTPIG